MLCLKVLKRSGTEQEKKHARRIMPVSHSTLHCRTTSLDLSTVHCSAEHTVSAQLQDSSRSGGKASNHSS
jgi:hypothetical protein